MRASIYKKLSRWIGFGIAFVFASQLGACAATELEERCFPMVVAVGYDDGKVSYGAGFPRTGNSNEGESQINEIQVSIVKRKTFEESKTKYESHLNKVTDYNHLKVLVLEEELMQQTAVYNEMLDVLASSEEFPRNTYVCAVDDIDDLMEIEKNLPQELGTYLEEYLNNHEERKGDLLTLGDLIDEKENNQMVLYIPYLEVEETYVEWGGYYAVGSSNPPVNFD